MSDVPYLDGDALRSLVPMPAAIAAVEEMFRAGEVEVPPRAHLPAGPGELLFMPASGPGGTGVKLVTVNPANPPAGRPLINGVYVLFSPDSLEPVLTIDGAALTALRTPAVSAVATRHLARRDARRLVVFGKGTQAHGHVDALTTVRDFDSVELAGRDDPPELVTGADVVCTCTTSRTPVFDGALLRPGTHVNAVGAYKPDARELDDAVMRRAAVFVEDRDAALAEAGDLLQPIAAGALDPASVRSLADLLHEGPPAGADVTVFKSVGLASEDLAVAAAAYAALG